MGPRGSHEAGIILCNHPLTTPTYQDLKSRDGYEGFSSSYRSLDNGDALREHVLKDPRGSQGRQALEPL